jgi:tRNA modification GTPase
MIAPRDDEDAMNWKGDGKTIFALATAFGRSAVAIIRISGPQAGQAFVALAGHLPKPRFASYRVLRDEHGGVLDHALALWFPGPASFTGEDCVEFHVHGGRAVVRAVLARLARLDGLRQADPGEFARRALGNGKLDVAAAEQLADIIDSETEQQRLRALRSTSDTALRIDLWRREMIEAAALIEAELDFADEEDVDSNATSFARSRIEAIVADMRKAVAAIGATSRLRDGVRVALAGPPNVGKSSLMNALVGRDQSIVSPIAGTTRDSIEAAIEIAGYLVILTDTAGLRESDDSVEQQGMARTRGRVAEADLVLWLEDGEAAVVAPPATGAALWRIASKGDLRPASLADRDALMVSAVRGDNVDLLRDRIGTFAAERCADDGLGFRQRHESRMRQALTELEHFLNVADGDSPELAAELLRAARRALDANGDFDSEAVLSEIFGRFCIGK